MKGGEVPGTRGQHDRGEDGVMLEGERVEEWQEATIREAFVRSLLRCTCPIACSASDKEVQVSRWASSRKEPGMFKVERMDAREQGHSMLFSVACSERRWER